MSNSGKKINAKSILSDIQTGMDEEEIKRKYALTDQGYQSVIEKLSARGLLKGDDDGSNQSKPEQKREPVYPEDPIPWRCPACGRPQTRVYEECPHCGVILAKFSAMASQGHVHPKPPHYNANDSDAKRSFRWPIIILSISAFLVVGGAILKRFSHKQIKESDSAFVPMPGAVRNFTTANFEREVKEVSKKTPVLVTFYADW
jgi:hypothetical protein